jgi:PiT family inorganic phosphate transporter
VTVLVATVALALLFDVTNGFHDSSNAVAALVATRAARPGQAVALAACCNVLGPLLVGTAVANTVGGIVTSDPHDAEAVVGAALTAALVWNLFTWWRGLPSSSSHALVGGLVGAALLSGGSGAVHWGGLSGARPTGLFGALGALAISPLLGFGAGLLAARTARRALRRAHADVTPVIRRSEWLTAGALAFSHGANDAQKTMGVITLLLLSSGHLTVFSVPLWVKLASACSLTLGVSFGGWRIVRTVGSRIYRMRALDGLSSQAASATIILTSALVGGPVSTTHVVSSSVAGVGVGRRWRRVNWTMAGEIGLAWVTTIPATAVLAAAALPAWRAVT